MSFTKGVIFGLAGGLVLGLGGTVVAKNWGINPHYSVNKNCLTTIEHLVDPHQTGKLLHNHLPSGHNIQGGDGKPILNGATNAPYRDFLTFLDDVRQQYGLPRIASSGDVDGHLGEHVLEGLCVK